MNDVLAAKASTLTEWADEFEREDGGGYSEAAFLARRLSAQLRRIAGDTVADDEVLPGAPAAPVEELRAD